MSFLKDWKRHKPLCRPGAKAKDVSATDASEDRTSPQDRNTVPGTEDAEHFHTSGKEYSIDMPDPNDPTKTVRMSSTTMSAAYMREVRDSALKLLQEKMDRPGAV